MSLDRRSLRPCLLSIGVIRSGSSYGRLFESLYAHLADAYRIHHIGIDAPGEVQVGAWTLHPNNVHTDVRGCETLRILLRELDPDIVLILGDLWKVWDPLRVIAASATKARVVVAAPVDGAIVEPGLVDFLSGIDRFVVFTEFSRSTVAATLRERLGERAGAEIEKISVIPNGVDRSRFYPLGTASDGDEARQGRIAARRALFPERPELLDGFIVLNASMNQPRKRLDLTLEAFAQFARERPPSVRLLLHSRWYEPGCDLRRLAERLGVVDRLLGVADPAGHPRVDDAMLNQIYNACEVGLNTSVGEGWGLVSFEHAATGAAQVLVRHPNGDELWSGAAELVEPVETLAIRELFLEAQVASVPGIARALERLHDSPSYLRQVSKACHANAMKDSYTWSAIAARWKALFEAAVESPRRSRGWSA